MTLKKKLGRKIVNGKDCIRRGTWKRKTVENMQVKKEECFKTVNGSVLIFLISHKLSFKT